MSKNKKGFSVPHVFVILVILLIVVTGMTYIVPAGEYGRVLNEATGKEAVDPAAFT